MSELKPCGCDIKKVLIGLAELQVEMSVFSDDRRKVLAAMNAIKKLETELENIRTQSQCERVKQLESALLKLQVRSCNCLTKTNEYQYHAEFCPTRIIGEALYALPPKEQGQ